VRIATKWGACILRGKEGNCRGGGARSNPGKKRKSTICHCRAECWQGRRGIISLGEKLEKGQGAGREKKLGSGHRSWTKSSNSGRQVRGRGRKGAFSSTLPGKGKNWSTSQRGRTKGSKPFNLNGGYKENILLGPERGNIKHGLIIHCKKLYQAETAKEKKGGFSRG